MANSVSESALIEAAALQEAASVLPAGDPGRRALEQQAASLRSRGVKFLAADEDETEEQWARRVVKEAMRFPLKGPTRWYPIVLEIMTSLGAKRRKNDAPYSGYVIVQDIVLSSLVVGFELDELFTDSVLDRARKLFAVINNHITDDSELAIFRSGHFDILEVTISVPAHISVERSEVLEDIKHKRASIERVADGRRPLPDIDSLRLTRRLGSDFYSAMVSGREPLLTPDDTLLFLVSYGIDVPRLLGRLVGYIEMSAEVNPYVIYGNTVVAQFPMTVMGHGASGVVDYPVLVTIAVPILRDLTDPSELEIPLGGVFDIQIGRPVDYIPGNDASFPTYVSKEESVLLGSEHPGFDRYDSDDSKAQHRNLVRSIQKDFDAGRDGFVDEVMEIAFERIRHNVDVCDVCGLEDLTFVEDSSWFHEWIAAGHAIPYNEFVVGFNVEAVRNHFMKLEKKWADYEADYKVKYPQMFKDREVEALWAVLKEKGIKPWKYSRRMNNPPTRGRKLARRGRRG